MKLRLFLPVALLALIFFTAGCQQKQKETKELVKYVKTEIVEPVNDDDKLVFNGFIKEQSLTTLSFRVGGPIVKMRVKAGDFVKKDEIIASIDKRDYELQLKSTKVQYAQIKGEYERYKELFEKDKIPANSYEKIESGYLMAKTAFENAQNQLRDTDLKAPFSGYIHKKMVESFQTVGAGTPIVSMIDISKLEVVISIPENLLNRVKQSKNSFLTVDNSDVSQLPLDRVSIGEKTGNDGMYEMKLNFENDPVYNIYPGMSAVVTMLCSQKNEKVLIPISAIFHQENSDYVWIYNQKSHTITKKSVKLDGLANSGFATISSGLSFGDVIVTAGVHYLHEGQEVKVLKNQSKSNVGGLL